MTKEVVKPVVHEQVEEHISRHIHNHEVYHKILPVRDVEVLPARHWVPGPDGRLIQVDEKDVYSGAAWKLAQRNTAADSELHQDQVRQQPTDNAQVDSGNTRTVKHTTVEQPKVIPGQVNQVYQTQVHQEEVDCYQIPRKPVNQGCTSETFSAPPASRPSGTQYEGVPSEVHQVHNTQLHDHPGTQHQTNEPQASQSQSLSSLNTDSKHSPRLYNASDEKQSKENQVHRNEEPLHRTSKAQMDERQRAQGQASSSAQIGGNRPPVSQQVDTQKPEHGGHHPEKHTEQHSTTEEGDRNNAGQRQDNGEQAGKQKHDNSQAEQVPTSPGLLDPYRVKNWPTHHKD